MSTLKPVNQPLWTKWTAKPSSLRLPDAQKFKELITKNPAELVRLIHYHLTNNPELTEGNIKKLARLIADFIDSESRSGGLNLAEEEAKAVLNSLPPEERGAIINELRKSGKNTIADKLIKNPTNLKMDIIYSALGKDGGLDSNRNGIFDSEDKKYKEYSHFDKDQNGYLNYYELSQAVPSAGKEIVQYLYDDIMGRIADGVVTESDLVQLAELAKENKEAAELLANVRASLKVKEGKYQQALDVFRQAGKNSESRLKTRFPLYAALLKYQSKLSVLEKFAVALPSKDPSDFIKFSRTIFVEAGVLTAKTTKTLITTLPPEAKELKSYLSGLLSGQSKTRAWEIKLDGKPFTGKISIADLEKEIEITAPKPDDELYSGNLTFVDDSVPVGKNEPNLDNPLFTKIKIPVRKLLKNISPGETWQLNIIGNKFKIFRSYNITRADRPDSLPGVALMSSEKYFDHLAERAAAGKPIKLSYVMSANKDAVDAKAITSDLYFRNVGAVLGNPWKLVPNDPEKKKDGALNIYARDGAKPFSKATYERRIPIEQCSLRLQNKLRGSGIREVVFRAEVEYYASTMSGNSGVFKKLFDENYSAVTVQGHRYKIFNNQLKEYIERKHPGYKGRGAPVAYFANHCWSWKYGVEPVAHSFKKVFAPVSTYQKTFPARELNLAFINGIVDGVVSGGMNFDGKTAAEIFKQADKRPGDKIYKDSQKYAINPDKEADANKNGIPDRIDPNPKPIKLASSR